MLVKKIIKNKAIGIVLIQVFSKITGIFREIILANFFGSSILFSDYLKLMTYGELIAIFCTEGGLGANLMKKFSLMHKRGVSFLKIKKQAIKLSFFIFFIVAVLQFFAWKVIINSTYNFTFVILISSVASAIVFYFNIGQIILLSSSNYSNLYKSNFFRSLVYLVLLYPLLFLFNVLGAALNRFFSVSSQYFNTWFVVNKKHLDGQEKLIGFSKRDFNIWVFLTNNSIFVWYVLLRVYFSLSEGVEIIFLTYGFIFALSFDGIIIKSFSTYLLERRVNVQMDIKKSVFFVALIAILVFILAVIFGKFVIELMFGFGKNFTEVELQSIYYYFILLLVLVSTNGLCNLVFQKVFSSRRKIQFYQSKRYILISLIVFSIISIISIFNFSCLRYLILIVFSFSIINLIYIYRLLNNERVV